MCKSVRIKPFCRGTLNKKGYMCTAVKINGNRNLFGRTLDVEASYGEKIIISKREYDFKFSIKKDCGFHYAILGMGCVADGYPLYFDAINEKGLAVAALSFIGNAVYGEKEEGRYNVASFEFIPWILSNCQSIAEAKELISGTNITSDSFSPDMPPTALHFIVADKEGSITIESVKDGIRVYENPLGVLTNNPTFDYHLANAAAYMYLDSRQSKNTIAPDVKLEHTSRGMGAFGMPGDYSSQSRFVRALFVKNHIDSIEDDGEVSRFFHAMDSVKVPYGCVFNEKGEKTYSVYTSCMDMERIVYYFTTYESRRIRAVSLFEHGVVGSGILVFDAKDKESIAFI